MRRSPAEIDYAILDVAAGIFATHGYAHASVQQIADAVGYSKPGLLHRFGSKEALYRAVMAEVADTVQVILDHVVSMAGRENALALVLEHVVRRALDRPGIVQMVLVAFDPSSQEPGTESTQTAGRGLLEALDPGTGGPAQRLRVALALQLIANAAVAQHSRVDPSVHVPREELVPLLVEIAGEILSGSVSHPAAPHPTVPQATVPHPTVAT